MSRREVVDCDRCGGDAGKEFVHLEVFKDRIPDAAGGMENTYAPFDLCPICVGALLGHLISFEPGSKPFAAGVRACILNESTVWPLR